MKKLSLSFILFFMFYACTRDQQPGVKTSTALITSFSAEKCMCCWGWNISINNKTYRFEKIPAASNLDLNTITYPATVKLKWKTTEGPCKENMIEVLEIARQ